MTSPRAVLLISFGLSSTSLCVGQTLKTMLDSTRAEVRKINANKAVIARTYSPEEYALGPDFPTTDGGESLIGYYLNKKLVKIVDWIGISYGFRVYEFYIVKDDLVFVYERFMAFTYDEKTGGISMQKPVFGAEGRYYFHNSKIIKDLFRVIGTGFQQQERKETEASLLDFLHKDRRFLENMQKKS